MIVRADSYSAVATRCTNHGQAFYRKPKVKAFMVVHVDDLQVVAKSKDHDKASKEVISVIDLDVQAPEERLLDCRCTYFTSTAGVAN